MRVWDVHNGIPAFAGGVLVAAPTPVHRMAIDIATPNASLPGAVTIAGWAFNEAAGPNAIGVGHSRLGVPRAGGAPLRPLVRKPRLQRPV